MNNDLSSAIRIVNHIRDNDCDFLTVNTLLAYGVNSPEIARQALLNVMGEDWLRKARDNE